MDKSAKIYVAGHQGLVGSAIMRLLQQEGYRSIVTQTFEQLDLRNQQKTEQFFMQERPDYVFLAAAKVGGIQANWDYPATFLYDNLLISANVIHAAYLAKVKKLLYLGSSCIYPKFSSQPIKEEYLLTGELEPTNEPYAVAKIAGIKLCQAYNKQFGTNFIACMPTNLYGPNDNFDLYSSHVIPALIAKIEAAFRQKKPTVAIWGSGAAHREFLFVDDLAEALLFLMNHYHENEIINVGTGEDISIADLARLIKKKVGYSGDLIFDTSKPDGTPKKLLYIEKLKNLGWQATTNLEIGLEKTINWYKNSHYSFV